MGITRQIVLEPTTRSILFSGDKTRLRLIRRLALELEKESKSVVLLSCADSLLPPHGQLVVGSNTTVLADQIQRAFVKDKLVHVASALSGTRATGFTLADIHAMLELLPDTYFLIDGGAEIPATANKAAAGFQQHCLCLDAATFKSEVEDKSSSRLLKTHSLIPANKTLLFVDAVRTLERENRLLSLSREWLADGVEHVVLADLSRDFLRTVEHA